MPQPPEIPDIRIPDLPLPDFGAEPVEIPKIEKPRPSLTAGISDAFIPREIEVSDNYTLVERIKALWTIVEMVVSELIQAAETLFGPGTGDQKRAYVIEKAMEAIGKMEEELDIVPDRIQSVVFASVRWALGMVVERVFRRLSADGVV